MKKGAKYLTFEYLLAMSSMVISLLLLINIINSIFSLWFNVATLAKPLANSWLVDILDISTITAGTSIISAVILAMLLAVISLICFKRTSKSIAERKDFTEQLGYKLITYGALGALLIPAIVLFAKLINILVDSLMFIGNKNLGEIFKSLYLVEFIPYAIGLILLCCAISCVKKIIDGKNAARLLAVMILSVSVLIFIATVVMIELKMHAPNLFNESRSYDIQKTVDYKKQDETNKKDESDKQSNSHKQDDYNKQDDGSRQKYGEGDESYNDTMQKYYGGSKSQDDTAWKQYNEYQKQAGNATVSKEEYQSAKRQAEGFLKKYNSSAKTKEDQEEFQNNMQALYKRMNPGR